jgi:flagellar hook-basal body complex protein FliE
VQGKANRKNVCSSFTPPASAESPRRIEYLKFLIRATFLRVPALRRFYMSSFTSIAAALIPPASTLASGAGLPAIQSASAAGQTAAPAPFSDLMTDAIGSVNQLQDQAQTAITGLMSGTGVDVHRAMIAAQKADMAFELTLAVRNKAVQAYQSVNAVRRRLERRLDHGRHHHRRGRRLGHGYGLRPAQHHRAHRHAFNHRRRQPGPGRQHGQL